MSLGHWDTYDDIRADLAAWLIVGAVAAAGGWFYAHHSIAQACERFGVFYSANQAFQCGKPALAPAPPPQAGASPVDSVVRLHNGRRRGWVM